MKKTMKVIFALLITSILFFSPIACESSEDNIVFELEEDYLPDVTQTIDQFMKAAQNNDTDVAWQLWNPNSSSVFETRSEFDDFVYMNYDKWFKYYEDFEVEWSSVVSIVAIGQGSVRYSDGHNLEASFTLELEGNTNDWKVGGLSVLTHYAFLVDSSSPEIDVVQKAIWDMMHMSIVDLSIDRRIVSFASSESEATNDMTNGGLVTFTENSDHPIYAPSIFIQKDYTEHKYWLDADGWIHQVIE